MTKETYKQIASDYNNSDMTFDDLRAKWGDATLAEFQTRREVARRAKEGRIMHDKSARVKNRQLANAKKRRKRESAETKKAIRALLGSN